MIKKVNKGILFCIEGFSGSGKTTLAKKIKSKINKLYGPTILINGDDIRSIFKLNDFSKLGRLNVFKKYVSYIFFHLFFSIFFKILSNIGLLGTL